MREILSRHMQAALLIVAALFVVAPSRAEATPVPAYRTSDLVQTVQYYYGPPGYYGRPRFYGPRYYGRRYYARPRFYARRYYFPHYYGRRYYR